LRSSPSPFIQLAKLCRAIEALDAAVPLIQLIAKRKRRHVRREAAASVQQDDAECATTRASTWGARQLSRPADLRKSAKAYGGELGKRSSREKGQIATPEETWVRREVDEIRIVTADLCERVDAKKAAWRQKATEAATRGRRPQNAGGKYLLSGGLLVSEFCGGHYEVFKAPWKPEGVYVCATRRRKPGVCKNTLTLPVVTTDEMVLRRVEDEALGRQFIDELLSLVDRGEADTASQTEAERERLRAEVSRLVASIAAGVPAESVAPAIRDREREIARLDVRLRQPRPVVPKVDDLRAALEGRAAGWKQTLRGEVAVARVLLRRLIGPLTMADDPTDHRAFDEWVATLTPALLEGLGVAIHDVASPAGFEPAFWP
jgi:hypothetical protein